MKRIALFSAILVAIGCSSSSSNPKAPAPLAAAQVTPTPGPMTRINPNVIEETATYYIERLPKKDYIKVDDRHIKGMLVQSPVEFFKEDDQYYYVSVAKRLPMESDLSMGAESSEVPAKQTTPAPTVESVSASDLEDLQPPRIDSPFRLQEVTGTALPSTGRWRASFAIADVNGDGIPDIIAPPPRLAAAKLYVWVGDGHGHFSEWPVSFLEKGKPVEIGFAYGGVAVGDIDGDGHADIVTASHSGGLISLFGDGKGGFEVVREGLPKDFSSQAVALVHSKENASPDLVASNDMPDQMDAQQVRVYRFLGRDKGWELRKGAIFGGSFSSSLHAWDYDHDGWDDILTGSQWSGDTGLLWHSEDGLSYKLVVFPEVEKQSFHIATVPGTFGQDRAPAFSDAYYMFSAKEKTHANGITLYVYQGGAWTKHRLWRKKDPKSNIYGIAMGDLNGDGLDDVVFLDNDAHRVRVLLQRADGSFSEIAEKDEPVLDSFGQCVRLADLDRDGRLDIVVSKTMTSANPNEKGGWSVYLNQRK